MLNNVYAELAINVAKKTQKDSGLDKVKTLDPQTILTILKVLTKIVECWASRQLDTNKVARKAKKPSLLDRMAMRKVVREAMGVKKMKLLFKDEHTKATDEVCKSILALGKDATPEKIQEMVDKYEETVQALNKEEVE